MRACLLVGAMVGMRVVERARICVLVRVCEVAHTKICECMCVCYSMCVHGACACMYVNVCVHACD